MLSEAPVSLVVGIGAICAIVLASLLPLLFRSPNKAHAKSPYQLNDDPLIFLFRDDLLLDANFGAQRLLRQHGTAGSEHDRLRLALAPAFDNVAQLTAPGCVEPDTVAQSRDGGTQLTREVVGDTVRLTLRTIRSDEASNDDIFRVRAMRNELETLRANSMTAPFLLWRLSSSGEPIWVNQAYLDTVSDILGSEACHEWPLPSLFPALSTVPPTNSTPRRRLSLATPDGAPIWFDCYTTEIGEDRLVTAFRADEAVRAETRRREFTQTLTKTFAELAIGLAIFDRARHLVLFNPALSDLTTLSSDFLSGRPSLASFLDRLREHRMMPEPRDYGEWRRSIAEIESAASDGKYSEMWSLPDGQTYRVTGRPHPDGAVALLFEDISAEMSLTRRFRSELQLSQSVIDALDDAVAAFSSSGDLILSNAAYRRLWDLPEQGMRIEENVVEATRLWHQKTVPTPIWGEFRDFVRAMPDRTEWGSQVAMIDGRRIECRFVPRTGGATLAIFRVADDVGGAETLRQVS